MLLSQFGTCLLYPCLVLTVASWPAYRFLRRQVRWSGIPISWRIFQFVVIHTVKGFGIVSKAEVDVFLELFFFMIQRKLGIWYLVPLSFLNPAWTSGNSWLMYCWSLAWRILSINSVWDECNFVVVWAFFAFLQEGKLMTNLDSILKSKDITLPTKVHLVKAITFPVVMYGCESWTVKKAGRQRIDAFELWCWKRLLRPFGLQGDPASQFWRRSALGFLWWNDAKAEAPVFWPPHVKS